MSFIHFEEADFEANFPTSADVFPTAQDNVNYLDAVLFNYLATSILAIEAYLIEYKENIESAGTIGPWTAILLEPGEWDYITPEGLLTSYLGTYA